MWKLLRSAIADLAGSLLVLAFFAPCPAQQAKAKPGPTPEMMMKLRQIGSVQVAPDGKRVVFTVREAHLEGEQSEYVTQIHIANSDGSEPLQLTHAAKSSDSPQWSPDGTMIAFLSSRAGKRDLWLMRVRGGEPVQLTAVRTAVSSYKWSPDGKTIAFTALDNASPEEEKATREKNDARVVDEHIKLSRLYVVSTEELSSPAGEGRGRGKRETRLLTKGNFSVNGGSRAGFDWSPDSKTIVVSHAKTPRPDDWTTSDLSLVDVASGTIKPLVGTPAAEFAPLYSPDGKSIAYVASDNPPTWGGTGAVHVIAAAGGSPPRKLADTYDRFGRYTELLGWSADGKRLYFAEARGTVLTINALPLDGPPEVIGQADGWGTGVHLNATRNMIGLSLEAPGRPAEAHISRAEKWEPVKVSNVNKELSEISLSKTEVIRWKSVDQQEIEGLLTYPAGYEKGKKYPLLLVIHGGPMGVFTQSCIANPGPYPVATFAARGYAVLRPNPRGSSGYGHKFRYANYGDWGGKDYQDLMSGVDHVISLGVADADKLGVMGWSYGGFMTSWIVTQTKRFKAASVGAGVTNLMSFTGTADIPGFLPDYFGGEFWDKFEAYRDHSAMFKVKGVTTPTLIQHGERDERVPLSQGLEFYNALKRQGCTTKMVIYPRTPHGIEEPKLLIDAMNRNVAWFEQYVR
jgi:dipeptidyl aminopeptidase/acylaminoacyl peptidase